MLRSLCSSAVISAETMDTVTPELYDHMGPRPWQRQPTQLRATAWLAVDHPSRRSSPAGCEGNDRLSASRTTRSKGQS